MFSGFACQPTKPCLSLGRYRVESLAGRSCAGGVLSMDRGLWEGDYPYPSCKAPKGPDYWFGGLTQHQEESIGIQVKGAKESSKSGTDSLGMLPGTCRIDGLVHRAPCRIPPSFGKSSSNSEDIWESEGSSLTTFVLPRKHFIYKRATCYRCR